MAVTHAAAADFPDPLVTRGGERVTSAEQWRTVRRPELLELFQANMYGRLPPAPASVEPVVLFEDTKAFGGLGTLREIELRFDVFGKTNPLPIRLLLAVPNDRPKAGVPVFVGMNFQGNHCLVSDPRVRLPDVWCYPKYPGVLNDRATDAGRGKAPDVWAFETALRRGYAVATFYNGDIQPDRPKVSEGFRAVQPTPDAPDATATVMAWAWGIMRAVDHLTTRPDIDRKRIAVVGHSRLGKTALVAGAFDERIALVIPHQAGCAGTGPNRHADPKAESVKRITTAFPHWFCKPFAAAGDDPSKLPFDQHELLALCAPRPVLYSNAAEDLWANPAGQFDMMVRATPVYRLLGEEGMTAAAVPPLGKLHSSRLGYFIRPGKHSMGPADWAAYLEFADTWLK
jgi:hypothetical protein